MACKQQGLNVRKQANWHFFIYKWMSEFLALSQLPLRQYRFTRVVFKYEGSRFFLYKIIWLKLPSIDQGQRQAISHENAEFFH